MVGATVSATQELLALTLVTVAAAATVVAGAATIVQASLRRDRHRAPASAQVSLAVVRAVGVAVVAAALSMTASLVLVRGRLDGSLPSTWQSLLGWLALTVVATVVAVLFSSSGPVVASVVAVVSVAPPSWVVVAVACFNEGDAFWGIAALMFIAMSSFVVMLTWVAVLAARWGPYLVRSLRPAGARR